MNSVMYSDYDVNDEPEIYDLTGDVDSEKLVSQMHKLLERINQTKDEYPPIEPPIEDEPRKISIAHCLYCFVRNVTYYATYPIIKLADWIGNTVCWPFEFIWSAIKTCLTLKHNTTDDIDDDYETPDLSPEQVERLKDLLDRVLQNDPGVEVWY